MQLSVYYETAYGKKVSTTLKRDKHGEYHVLFLTINNTTYNSKQIRTVKRENAIIRHAEDHVDIDEIFADAQAENFRTNF